MSNCRIKVTPTVKAFPKSLQMAATVKIIGEQNFGNSVVTVSDEKLCCRSLEAIVSHIFSNLSGGAPGGGMPGGFSGGMPRSRLN